jgi:hypothetical protein
VAATHQRDDLHSLVETALEMGQAELRRDETTLRRILSKDLRFRRANGEIVDKEEFLMDLQDPRNTYDCLESDVVDVTVYENSAIVVLVVLARGTRRGQGFEGTYRNIRLFTRDPQESASAWSCALWLSTRIGAAGC